MNQLISKCQKALITVDKYYDAALQHVRSELIIDGKLSRDNLDKDCLLYTSPSPRDATLSRMPSSA